MEELAKQHSKGKQNRVNPAYHSLNTKRWKANNKGDWETVEKLLKQMQSIHVFDPMDENFIQVKYVRYADDCMP